MAQDANIVVNGKNIENRKQEQERAPERAREHQGHFRREHLRLVSISESTRESTNLSQNIALKGPIERALLSLVASTKESTRERTQGKASKRVLGGELDSEHKRKH